MAEVPISSEASRKVSVRWTPMLADAGWTPVVDFFLDNYHRLTPALKYSEAMFTIHVMRHKWDRKAPHPGFKLVAKRMGISPEATRLIARSLEKKGYLVRRMRVGQTNRFAFEKLFEALEKLMEADRLAKLNQISTDDELEEEAEAPVQVVQHLG